jgi:hypothetical protein
VVWGIVVIVMSCDAEWDKMVESLERWFGRYSKSFVHAFHIHDARQDNESLRGRNAFTLLLYFLGFTFISCILAH